MSGLYMYSVQVQIKRHWTIQVRAFLMQQFFGHSVDNLIGRIIREKVDGCSCMISESFLLCCHAQKSKAVRANCIVTEHGFERKAWGEWGKRQRERRSE